MPRYVYKPSVESYGQAVGIILLDRRVPSILGDVGNASSFRYPVIYRSIPGFTVEKCRACEPGWAENIIKAAIELEQQGVRGISSNCGFMIQYQQCVRDAVSVPVCLSSLLQLPLIAASIDKSGAIGVVTSASRTLSVELLERNGVRIDRSIIIKGIDDEAEIRTAVLEERDILDSDLMAKQTAQVAKRLVADHPNVRAILLESAALAPYAKAVQEATDLPVHDFLTLIDFMQSGTHQRVYCGYY